MAFDGITTYAMTKELEAALLFGKIDKIHQPRPEELVFLVHTREGNKRLYANVSSASSCVRLINENPVNPPEPYNFCMLLRKHLLGSRIAEIRQKDSERIIEFVLETRNELGFTVARLLVFEIMGRHSNAILVDMETGKIVDGIKHVSLDASRARQVLPGKKYEYPPAQDKIPFKEAAQEELDAAGETGKAILARIGGISPAIADELAEQKDRYGFLRGILDEIESLRFKSFVYADEKGMPREYGITTLTAFEGSHKKLTFNTLSEAAGYFYENREATNRTSQSARELIKNVSQKLEKCQLKKQKLSEDLKEAEDSDSLRLYGELLTANMHLLKNGMSEVTLTNYYDGSMVTIALDPRFSPNKNAQQYFHRYGKSRTAIKEKTQQIAENDELIAYLESVLSSLERAEDENSIAAIREELEESGLIRHRGNSRKNRKPVKQEPIKYVTSDGFTVLVGRNNKENDILTLRTAAKTDLWLHTKDIPGSHVIVRTEGKAPTETAIREAASIAAYHSKARASENVPVDYVLVKYVKKPGGAKPGMVIFTDNNTVYADPKLPGSKD